MRHAQYRRELADAVQAVTVRPVAEERRAASATFPALTVTWVSSTLERATGWSHTYTVEIAAAEHGPELDTLVALIAVACADWRSNTSAARPSPPRVAIYDVVDGDVTYPAVTVTTTVTEPST